jgi:hypothetical protein
MTPGLSLRLRPTSADVWAGTTLQEMLQPQPCGVVDWQLLERLGRDPGNLCRFVRLRGGCRRRASASYAPPASPTETKPPDDADDDGRTIVLSVWQYLGSGYLNSGDALLAAAVEASLQAAREALLDLQRGTTVTIGSASGYR